ncbi:MAG: proline racemase [Clostridiales bacterium]|nr:proline racemase [Clostridiales bacterium]
MNLTPIIDEQRFDGSFTVVDSHTMGEPTRIVLSGVPDLPGNTMIEKKEYFLEHYDWIRTALMYEPRGHKDMFGAVITKPVHEEADYGILFIEAAGCLNMCGHGTIGAVTVLINTGIVEAVEPVTYVTLDAPAGIIRVKANVKDGKVESVTLTNAPAFLYKSDLTTVIDGKEIKYDISFGGSFFTLVDVSQFGLDISTSTVNELIPLGMKILPQVNKEVEIKHPELNITVTDVCEFYGEPHDEGSDTRNVVVFGQNSADRSPCGTGTCAKMAFLHSKNELPLNQKYVNESFIGTKFIGELTGTTKVGDFDAVIPNITGSAYITGTGKFYIDPDDPLRHGFLLG